MRRFLIAFGLLAVLAIVLSPFGQSQSESKNQTKSANQQAGQKEEKQPVADRGPDETAIRANVAAFVKAFNDKDSKAVAALFAPDGQIVDKEGTASVGRDAIEKAFADLFAQSPKKRIEVTIDFIRFIGSDLAMEEGSTKEIEAPGEAPEYDRYTVLHTKHDGKWLMALARDEEGPSPTSHDQLRPLAWLVGEWVDDGGSEVVYSTCRWSEDGNFLLQDFKVQIGGKPAMQVSQRIGWDPLAKTIRSWVFDSEGGFGESTWSRNGDNWVIKATGVRPDGKAASATNTLVPIGKNGYLWRSNDRIVGNESNPSTEVKVVRKPPEAKP